MIIVLARFYQTREVMQDSSQLKDFNILLDTFKYARNQQKTAHQINRTRYGRSKHIKSMSTYRSCLTKLAHAANFACVSASLVNSLINSHFFQNIRRIKLERTEPYFTSGSFQLLLDLIKFSANVIERTEALSWH